MIMSPGLLKYLVLTLLFFPSIAKADPVEKINAILNLLDKTSNIVTKRTVGINSNFNWGTLEIKIYSCYSSPPEDIPEDYVLLEIVDISNDKQTEIYRGWMISSSPDVATLEHPIYDLWLIDCKVDNAS